MMVSLRRKKYTVMVERGQRRSARLLALEEQKNEKASHSLLSIHDWQTSAVGHASFQTRGKKKRVRITEACKEAHCPQEAGNSSTNLPALQKHTDQIIEYILDVLEVKDTNELFCMPDNIQANDYDERVHRPGDFATLRQKHKDGMYATLEQFESDVHTVFRKAMDSNVPDSFIHREALCLQDQAKQVFNSLKNNQTYSVLELSAWHQKYFNNRRRPVRNDGNAGSSSFAAQPRRSSRPRTHSDMKQSSMTINIRANGRTQSMNSIPNLRRTPQARISSRLRKRKADTEEHSTSGTEQRRCTYRPGNDSSGPIVSIFHKPPVHLVYSNSLGYKESLMHYVKNAGPQAKMAAENKCQEYDQRERDKSMSFHSAPYSSVIASDFPLFRSLSSHPKCAADQAASNAGRPTYLAPTCTKNIGDLCLQGSSTIEADSTSFKGMDFSYPATGTILGSNPMEGPSCRLDTDELLRLFSIIGTPEFLERSKDFLSSSSKQAAEPDHSFSSLLSGARGQRMAAEQNYRWASSMTQPGQFSNLKQPKQATFCDSSFSQFLPSALKPQEQKRFVSPAPYQCSTSNSFSSSNLGFSAYARSRQPFKLSTSASKSSK